MKGLVRSLSLLLVTAGMWGGDSLPVRGEDGRGLVTASRQMVAAAHPEAARAGLEMLRRGGSAVDAAIAAQLVLNLVEPQSSGIGGGAFLLHYDSGSAEVIAYDGRETAPRMATPELFLDSAGQPMEFIRAVVGGRAVGVPGVMALMARAHADHGKLPWADLFSPAIRLAREGFVVGRRLAGLLAGPRGQFLRSSPEAEAYFFPGGEPLEEGERKTNPAFADTLERIAEQGATAFYEGDIARDIVQAVQTAPGNPGLLSRADLAAYHAIRRDPVCHRYRQWRICGMGPPSSGGLTVGGILGMIEHHDLAALGPENPRSWHVFLEASKLAFADRNLYMADSDFVGVPTDGLLDRDYLAGRAGRIRAGSALETPVSPGLPPGAPPEATGSDRGEGRAGTSHLSVVDSRGNAVSMTTSIEGAFGSQLMVRGFLLNNQLTDFSFAPEKEGRAVANRVQAGKRPRSSMSPTLVLDESGSLRLVIGSPGGSRIIGYVAKTLVAVLDWGLDMRAAIHLPHVVNRNGRTEIEEGAGAEALQVPLAALGHDILIRGLTSGLHGIERTGGTLHGAADPRREGIAVGD